MFGISADVVNIWANWGLVAALVLGVIATYAIVVSANIKEGNLKRELSAAGYEAATANERAAQLEIDAANIRLEYERLKQQVAWRQITPAQRDAIVNTLRSQPLRVDVAWFSGDPEATAYAEQIELALRDAGATVATTPWLALDRVPIGVMISAHGGPDAELLVMAFRRAGIAMSEGHKRENLLVFVGTKPPRQREPRG